MTETSRIVLAAVNVNLLLLDGATVFTQHSDLIRGLLLFSAIELGQGHTASRAELPMKDVPFTSAGNHLLAHFKGRSLM